MDLRTRILFGYGYLVSIIVVSAVGAALGFNSLGARLSYVLDENFSSIRWSMEMVEALERQDSVLLAALLGDEGTESSLEESERAFLTALEKAKTNVTEDRESEIVERVEREYRSFREARDRLLSASHERPLTAYRLEAYPRFDTVKRSVVELLDVNHLAMIAADQQARASAFRNAVGHALVVVVALLSLACLSGELRREVLSRLADLESVAQAMAAGDLDRRADATKTDELGLLATQLNELLDHNADLRGRMEARLAGANDLVVGLLAARREPAALLRSDGRLVASTMSEEATERVRRAWIDRCEENRGSDGCVDFVELHYGPRSVGWLATLSDGEPE